MLAAFHFAVFFFLVARFAKIRRAMLCTGAYGLAAVVCKHTGPVARFDIFVPSWCDQLLSELDHLEAARDMKNELAFYERLANLNRPVEFLFVGQTA